MAPFATPSATTQGSYLLTGNVANNNSTVNVSMTYTPAVNASSDVFQQMLNFYSENIYR